MNEAEQIREALLEYPIKIYDAHPTDPKFYLYGKNACMVNGKVVVIPDFRPRDACIDAFPKVTDTPPMPRVKPPKLERVPSFNEQFKEFLSEMKAAFGAEIPRKEVISTQPGDVIVANSPTGLSDKERFELRLGLDQVFPDNKAVILENGITLEVYREQEISIDSFNPGIEPLPEGTISHTASIEISGMEEQVKDV